MVICGNEHVIYGYGVPDRVTRRLPLKQARLIMPLSGERDELTAAAADFAWVTPPAPRTKRVRLGIALRSNTLGELILESIVPGSEAERIGLRKGDRLLRMDGHHLQSLLDMHRAAILGGTDKTHELTIERGGRKLTFDFQFRE